MISGTATGSVSVRKTGLHKSGSRSRRHVVSTFKSSTTLLRESVLDSENPELDELSLSSSVTAAVRDLSTETAFSPASPRLMSTKVISPGVRVS